jgi:hypothetical protein
VLHQNDTIYIKITVATGWWWKPSVIIVILSSNGPADITRAHCRCGSPINKLLRDLCKPYSPEAFNHTVRLPKFSTENFPGARAIIDLPRTRVVAESSLEPLRCHSWSRSSPLYELPSFLTQASDVVDHAGAVPIPTMPSTPHHSRDYNNIVIPESMTLCTSRCCWAHDTMDPAPSPGP